MTATSKKRKAEPQSDAQEEDAATATGGEGLEGPPMKKCFTDQDAHQEQTQGDGSVGDDQGQVEGEQVSQEQVPEVEVPQEENGQEDNGEVENQKENGNEEIGHHDSNGEVNVPTSSGQELASEDPSNEGAGDVDAVAEPATTSNTMNATSTAEMNGNPQVSLQGNELLPEEQGSVETHIAESTTAPALPPGVPMGVPMALPQNVSLDTTTPLTLDKRPKVGVPTTRVPMQTANPTTSAAAVATAVAGTAAASSTAIIITEKENIPVQYVGRIIGKGGEQIRDLQARSACKVDVDQNVPHGAPRVITYQGTRDKIDFAKSLVAMLCKDNWKTVELPLGFASRAQLQVPSGVIGKIIGRGGEMIKELQSKSYAKIQVDHTAGGDVSYRTVTVTGNELSVKRAEEMINLIIANPLADASSAVDMLIREKAQGTSEWGSGPPYVTMPNNGFGMPPSNMAAGGTGAGGMVGGYGQHQQQQQPMQYGSYTGGYGQQLQQQAPPSAQPSYGHYGSTASRGGGSGGLESEIFYSSKSYMGRIIGQKGVTINDLQKRSGCDIQINQNVPMGQDCEVHIKGSRQGIEMAKQMLNEILQMGPNHPYAGGQGGGGSGGGYQQPTGYMQQQAAYGQTQPQYQQHYGQQAQYGTTPNQYGYMQQTQMQQPTPQYGAPYGSGQAYGYVQQPQTQLAYQQPAVAAAYSPWKTATSPDGQIYYYNEKTNETTWDKPAGMP